MSYDYKRALALDERTYLELLDKGFMRLFHERATKNMCREVKTQDGMVYKVFLWDWEPDPEKWDDLMSFLEHRRHALMEIREDGQIWRSVETRDGFGCDGVFEEIFGWTSSICLWQDTSQIIV